jgi:hypothetical protein
MNGPWIVACVLAVSLASWAMAQAPAGASRPTPVIAVFSEPKFLNYGGLRALTPEQVVELLKSAGLEAETLSVQQLATPGTLSTDRYAALVMPYGNAFPIDAFAQLRAYRAAGGITVLTGIPFCHPTALKDGQWQSLGGKDYFGHNPEGVGTGGFRDGASGLLRVATPGFAPNVLGLTADELPDRGPVGFQYLDVASFAKEDRVTPILEVVDPQSQKRYPVSALIQHRCGDFDGAIDLWLGPVASRVDEEDRYLASQLILRGLSTALREKKLLTPALAQQIQKTTREMHKPSPLPKNLAFTPTTRPADAHYVPKSNPPARRLLVVNTRDLNNAQKAAIGCLQGLTSRDTPILWIVRDEPTQFWLDWHVKQKHIDGYDVVADWKSLFQRFNSSFKGAILYDADLYRGDLLAANVAAVEDLILATPELAAELNLPVKIDLRGKFKTYADGLEWLWAEYGSRLNPALADYFHPDRFANMAFAYNLQHRAFMFWLAGDLDSVLPGADPVREKAVIARILSQRTPNGVVLGFPYAGEGVGPGEPAGVELISRYGMALVCTDSLTNASVMSGVRVESLSTPKATDTPKLERDKIYVALAVSDGDNQNVWTHFMRDRYFDHRRFGEFPVAFGIGPPIIDLQPGVAQYYYQKANDKTEFIADVSGIGYIHPDHYGSAYKDSDAVMAGFLEWTRDYLPRVGLGTLRTVGGDDRLLQQYARQIPGMHSLFADMGNYSGREGIANLTYTMEEMPIFRAVTSWRYGKDGFHRELQQHVGSTRPAFVNGFVHCWTFDSFDKIAEIYDQRPADMVFVTPSQLAELYEQARQQGWTK